ncbi:hypothetical protein [Flexivirga sp. B27]
MTTTRTTASPADDDTTRKWAKRFATLLVCWGCAWLFTHWLVMRPDPVGLLGAIGVLFVIIWWASDRRLDWDPAEWEGDPAGRRLRTSADSRISYLRRQIENASSTKNGGELNASAGSLQGILRDLTLDRLRLRAAESGAAHVPDDAELLAGTDPKLSHYLTTQPAPLVNQQTVNDIINRIEAL